MCRHGGWSCLPKNTSNHTITLQFIEVVCDHANTYVLFTSIRNTNTYIWRRSTLISNHDINSQMFDSSTFKKLWIFSYLILKIRSYILYFMIHACHLIRIILREIPNITRLLCILKAAIEMYSRLDVIFSCFWQV